METFVTMLFHKYIERIIGSKVKIKILRAMFRFPGKRFTIRELASFIKITHPAILKCLDDLQGMGLIRIERHGQSNLLNLNQKSHLYKILKNLFLFEAGTKQSLIKRLKQIISKKAKMAVLFGSIQKGAERMGSDIDLLIVTDNKRKSRKELENYNTDEFGNVISSIILTEDEFKRKKNKAFAKDILKSYYLIKGEDLIAKYWER